MATTRGLVLDAGKLFLALRNRWAPATLFWMDVLDARSLLPLEARGFRIPKGLRIMFANPFVSGGGAYSGHSPRIELTKDRGPRYALPGEEDWALLFYPSQDPRELPEIRIAPRWEFQSEGWRVIGARCSWEEDFGSISREELGACRLQLGENEDSLDALYRLLERYEEQQERATEWSADICSAYITSLISQ